MPCRSVLMQISCLIRGICDYEEIARRFLSNQEMGSDCVHSMAGRDRCGKDGEQDVFIMGEDSEVAEGQRSLKPRYSVHPFTKT